MPAGVAASGSSPAGTAMRPLTGAFAGQGITEIGTGAMAGTGYFCVPLRSGEFCPIAIVGVGSTGTTRPSSSTR